LFLFLLTALNTGGDVVDPLSRLGAFKKKSDVVLVIQGFVLSFIKKRTKSNSSHCHEVKKYTSTLDVDSMHN